MKAITLKNPWAFLLLTGHKTLESRKGAILSRHTGPLAIHCSARSPGWLMELERLCEVYELDVQGHLPPSWWKHGMDGCIIGTVVAGRTRRYRPLLDTVGAVQRAACFDGDIEKRYLTPITEPRWLDKPVPMKGALWLQEWTP